jgi:hypothetical protein
LLTRFTDAHATGGPSVIGLFDHPLEHQPWHKWPLHARCRSGSIRASPEPIPEEGSPPGSDIA